MHRQLTSISAVFPDIEAAVVTVGITAVVEGVVALEIMMVVEVMVLVEMYQKRIGGGKGLSETETQRLGWTRLFKY